MLRAWDMTISLLNWRYRAQSMGYDYIITPKLVQYCITTPVKENIIIISYHLESRTVVYEWVKKYIPVYTGIYWYMPFLKSYTCIY